MLNKKIQMNKIAFVLSVGILISSGAFAGNEDRAGQSGAGEILINPWARASSWGSANSGFVHGVERMANECAHYNNQRQNQPAVSGCERQGIVIADHDKHDRQRKVIVVEGSLFGDGTQTRVWLFSAQERCNDDALVWHDHQKHVCHHHSAYECTHLHECAATAENVIKGEAQRYKKDKTRQRKH